MGKSNSACDSVAQKNYPTQRVILHWSHYTVTLTFAAAILGSLIGGVCFAIPCVQGLDNSIHSDIFSSNRNAAPPRAVVHNTSAY